MEAPDPATVAGGGALTAAVTAIVYIIRRIRKDNKDTEMAKEAHRVSRRAESVAERTEERVNEDLDLFDKRLQKIETQMALIASQGDRSEGKIDALGIQIGQISSNLAGIEGELRARRSFRRIGDNEP